MLVLVVVAVLLLLLLLLLPEAARVASRARSHITTLIGSPPTSPSLGDSTLSTSELSLPE